MIANYLLVRYLTYMNFKPWKLIFNLFLTYNLF